MNKESIPAAPEGNVGLLESTEGIDQETKRFIEVNLFLYMISFFCSLHCILFIQEMTDNSLVYAEKELSKK